MRGRGRGHDGLLLQNLNCSIRPNATRLVYLPFTMSLNAELALNEG